MPGALSAQKPCVLLISPGIIKWTDLDFGLPHLVSLGGYLQETLDVRVELLDLSYEGGDHTHLERTLDDLGPFTLIGIACYSSYDYLRVMTLARFLKTLYPDVPLVTGGYHVSALPDDLVFDGSPFDAAVVGEGEVPFRKIVETVMGGGRIEHRIWGPANLPQIDVLPPYKWELLDRYWPKAKTIGRKFQIYFSRGCVYKCTFCMERAKTEYQWRAFSPERAIDELERLSKFTDLSHWIINIADPLFGFQRRWRRQVLEGILERGLLPRQFWTLTRSDDLDDMDVKLLAKARFSIGIGMESGSPDMLVEMQKAKDPERYLAALERLNGLSRKYGLNWAANIILGHPGETLKTMQETRDVLWKHVTSAPETCGWLSFDPFRLYPGALVHEQREDYERRFGTRFYHPEWWKSWYDAPFRAEHIDPSGELSYEDRVRFMFDAYGPLVQEVHKRFRGQGRSVDRAFARSIDEQARLMSPQMRDYQLKKAKQAKAKLAKDASSSAPSTKSPSVLRFPIGLHVRDPWVRRREEAVRRLLEHGVLRTDSLTEALLSTAPERFMSEDEAMRLLQDASVRDVAEGNAPKWLPIRVLAMGLEALEPSTGDRVADLGASSGYVAALLAHLVGEQGEVVAVSPAEPHAKRRLWPLTKPPQGPLSRALKDLKNVRVVSGDGTTGRGLKAPFDQLWLGGALPRFPGSLTRLLADPGGRAVTFLGPRFRPQDLVCLVRHGDRVDERIIARTKVPALSGQAGWLVA